MSKIKVDRLTGQQIQYLRDRFNLQVGTMDFGRNVTTLNRPPKGDVIPMLKASTVCKMLGVAEDSPAIKQSGKWVEVHF